VACASVWTFTLRITGLGFLFLLFYWLCVARVTVMDMSGLTYFKALQVSGPSWKPSPWTCFVKRLRRMFESNLETHATVLYLLPKYIFPFGVTEDKMPSNLKKQKSNIMSIASCSAAIYYPAEMFLANFYCCSIDHLQRHCGSNALNFLHYQ